MAITSQTTDAAGFWDSVYKKTGSWEQATKATTKMFGPPPSQPSQATGPSYGVLNEALQGATFGFGTQIQAANPVAQAQHPGLMAGEFDPLAGGIPTQPVPEGAVQQNLQGIRQAQQQFRSEHPLRAGAANLVGGLLSGAAITPQGVLGTIPAIGRAATGLAAKKGLKAVAGRTLLRGAEGAASGALTGIGEGVDPEFGAKWGAVAGVVLGPMLQKAMLGGQALAQRGLSKVTAGRIPLPKSRADREVLRLWRQAIVEHAGENPDDLVTALGAKQALFSPADDWVTIADVSGSANLRALVRNAANTPGRSMEILSRFHKARARAEAFSPKGLADDLHRVFGQKSRAIADIAETLEGVQRGQANPLYEMARATGQAIEHPDLPHLLKEPAVELAYDVGRTLVHKEAALASGDLAQLAAVPPASGKPTIAELHYIKRGLDTIIRRWEEGQDLLAQKTGRGTLDDEVRGIIKPIRDRIMAIASASSPEYAQASKIWSHYEGMLNGLKEGQKAATLPAEKVALLLDRFQPTPHATPDQVASLEAARTMFRAAYLRVLEGQVLGKKYPAALLASPATLRRLAVVLEDDPQSLEAFATLMQTKAQMVEGTPLFRPGTSVDQPPQSLSFSPRFLALKAAFHAARSVQEEKLATITAQFATARGQTAQRILRDLLQPQPSDALMTSAAARAGVVGAKTTLAPPAPAGVQYLPR